MSSLLIREVIGMYIKHCNEYYDNGEGPTRQVGNIRSGLKPLGESMGGCALADLSGPRFANLRDEWARAGDVLRSTVNKRMQYVSQMIGWGNERGLVAATQLAEILNVRKIKSGRFGIRDGEPVGPANAQSVAAVMPMLTQSIRAMMEMVELTGMRPGEARLMRADLEPVNGHGQLVFRYSPSRHKSAHWGRRRRIFLVGRSHQLAVEQISTLIGSTLFSSESKGYLFSPVENGRRPYAANSVQQAVRRACEQAGVEKWAPNQLRHSYGTATRAKGYQLELIADLLGHADPRTTLIYAEPDDRLAIEATIALARGD